MDLWPFLPSQKKVWSKKRKSACFCLALHKRKENESIWISSWLCLLNICSNWKSCLSRLWATRLSAGSRTTTYYFALLRCYIPWNNKKSFHHNLHYLTLIHCLYLQEQRYLWISLSELKDESDQTNKNSTHHWPQLDRLKWHWWISLDCGYYNFWEI